MLLNSDVKKGSLIRIVCIIEGVVFHTNGALPCTHQGQICGAPVSLAPKKGR